ncbi:FAD/NAD-binding domain-containing protein [Crassisporium funariophilum]|nr:FAD/NAD-binding domain-containing protein [Crassisporium funariophilum]
MSPLSRTPGPAVVIIGAGFGGIATAISLKRHGFEDFIIVDKASDVGGTWKTNTYPGCSSDVPIHLYSLSTDLKHDWTSTCESQPNILAYIEQLVAKYNLTRQMLLNIKVISAEWNSNHQTYSITTEDVKSGYRSVQTAKIIISAHGLLHIPKMPEIPGFREYRGTVMHSAQWNNALDLRGKRIAVIGNGGSAAQLIPHIAKIEGTEIAQFIRTRNWYLPAMNAPIGFWWIWAFQNIPFFIQFFRILIFVRFELAYLILFKTKLLRGLVMKIAGFYLTSTSPKKYHDMLIPTFPVGCRRIIYDNGYLEALHRPNLVLKRSGIASATSDGIITHDGEALPFDVIICATGFIIGEVPFTLTGSNQSSIQEFYASRGGPEAYLGTTVPGFPNFYHLSGPNTATGYMSVLFFNEAQLDHIMQLVKPVLQGRVSSFEVTLKAHEAYNKNIQEKILGTVWQFCGSWYRVGGIGKNISGYPFSCVTFWWRCQNVDWTHYKAVTSSHWTPRPNVSQTAQAYTALASFVLVATAALWFMS